MLHAYKLMTYVRGFESHLQLYFKLLKVICKMYKDIENPNAISCGTINVFGTQKLIELVFSFGDLQYFMLWIFVHP